MGWRTLLATAAIVTAASDARANTTSRPRPGSELALAELSWPASTRSAEATAKVDVLRKIGRARRIGKLARGTRVAWKRIVAANDACKAYLEIEPRGFVCAKQLAPSDLPPAPADHAVPSAIVERTLGKLQFGVGPLGALAYDSPAAIRRKDGKKLVEWKFLHDTIEGVTAVGGELFVKTIEGYVAAADLIARPASTFTGVAIDDKTPWPLGWVVGARREELVTTRAAPSTTAAPVRRLAYRTRLTVHEIDSKAKFARVGASEWIALDEIAIASTAKRPVGVRTDERWLDVDLDENVLVAYAGDRPVYATLVSTGFGSTPVSLHRIRKKHAMLRLVSPEVATGRWDLPDVPFMMEFRKYYGLHGVYWHDSFGKKRGHGCVNLAPKDAAFLYEWTLPHVPPGWQERSADADHGTPIRIRNRANPNPPWTDFDAPPPVQIRDVEAP